MSNIRLDVRIWMHFFFFLGGEAIAISVICGKQHALATLSLYFEEHVNYSLLNLLANTLRDVRLPCILTYFLSCVCSAVIILLHPLSTIKSCSPISVLNLLVTNSRSWARQLIYCWNKETQIVTSEYQINVNYKAYQSHLWSYPISWPSKLIFFGELKIYFSE